MRLMALLPRSLLWTRCVHCWRRPHCLNSPPRPLTPRATRAYVVFAHEQPLTHPAALLHHTHPLRPLPHTALAAAVLAQVRGRGEVPQRWHQSISRALAR